MISNKVSSSHREPWVLICGGFHALGGMDCANLALAERLVKTGHPVFLVGHEITDFIARQPGVTVVRVPRPAGSVLLGESQLIKHAEKVSRRVKASDPDAILVANGGNGMAADVNWLHYVHAAAGFEVKDASMLLKAKNRISKQIFRRHEIRAVQRAKLVIANSELTRRHAIQHLGIDANRIETIYLGSNPDFTPPTPEERLNAREWLNISANVPVIAFVGVLGPDNKKGLDTLCEAWKRLLKESEWTAHLVVAGGGSQVRHWRNLANKLSSNVHILGFTDRIRDVLAASDLLVSPVRYESYGLNVHEAICRGLPAIVTRSAGVAELYPNDLRKYLLADPSDHNSLAQMLKAWSNNIDSSRQEFRALSDQLRSRTWEDMADQFIATTHARLRPSSSRLHVVSS